MLGLAVLKRKPGRGLAEPNDVKMCEIRTTTSLPYLEMFTSGYGALCLLASLKADPVMYIHVQGEGGRVSSSRDIPY